MEITLVIPTLNRYDLLGKTLETFMAGTVKPDRVVVINNGAEPLFDKVGNLDRVARNLMEVTPPRNLGVAGSCNLAMKLCIGMGSLWLHSNDDVEVGPRMVEGLKERFDSLVSEEESALFTVPPHGAGSLFTVFLADPGWLEECVGWWDETFFPAYFEDNDYARRLVMSGYKYRNILEPNGQNDYIHHTSSTRARQIELGQEDVHGQFAKCQSYYIRKWGGPPEFEKFTIPFDGEAESAIPMDPGVNPGN
jgi:GT2 family glycosyltransferase